jgi:hypothetical protein
MNKSLKLYFKDDNRDFTELYKASEVLASLESGINKMLGHKSNNFSYYVQPSKKFVNRVYVLVHGVLKQVKLNFITQQKLSCISFSQTNELLKMNLKFSQDLSDNEIQEIIKLKKSQKTLNVTYSRMNHGLSFVIDFNFLDRVLKEWKQEKVTKEQNIPPKNLPERPREAV